MTARVQLGWVDPADLETEEGEETEDAEEAAVEADEQAWDGDARGTR